MSEKFCVYCQEVTPHYVNELNEYGCFECCNCEPMSGVRVIMCRIAAMIQLMFETVVIVIKRYLLPVIRRKSYPAILAGPGPRPFLYNILYI